MGNGWIEPGEKYHDLVLQSQSSMVECTPSGTGSSVVERLFYTQLVRGSSPFPCTTRFESPIMGGKGTLEGKGSVWGRTATAVVGKEMKFRKEKKEGRQPMGGGPCDF